MFFYFFLILFALLLLWLKKQLTPAPEIAHLPAVPFWQNFYSVLILQEPLSVRFDKIYKSIVVNKENKTGCFRAWFGKWIVAVYKPEIAKQVFQNTEIIHKATQEIDLGPHSLFTRFWGTNLVFSNGDVWKKHRTIANPAFHNDYLQEVTPQFSECAALLVKLLGEKVSAEGGLVKDVGKWNSRMTLDALGKASFGFDFHSLDDPNSEYVSIYHAVLGQLLRPVRFMFPMYDALPTKTNTSLIQNIEKFDQVLFSVIENMRKKIKDGTLNESEKRSLLHRMIISTDEGGMNDKELRDNMVIFFLAGHDTSSTSLTTALYYMAKHPEIQEKARQEALSILGGKEVATYEDQKKAEYLTAVIKEGLRIVPPVTVLPRRMATKRIQVGDITLPEGQVVNVNIYALHHDPEAWGEDVEEFKPERFLVDPTQVEKQNRRHPFQWVPFGGGPRTCIGNNFSLIEQRIVLMTLLKNFSVHLVHPDDRMLIRGLLVNPKIDLVFKKR